MNEVLLESKGLSEQKLHTILKTERLKNRQAKIIFGKDYDKLTHSEQQRITSYFDVTGSASLGEYGFGHQNYEMEFNADRFGNDAFAGMYVAVLHDYKEFQTAYPAMWNFIKSLLNR